MAEIQIEATLMDFGKGRGQEKHRRVGRFCCWMKQDNVDDDHDNEK